MRHSENTWRREEGFLSLYLPFDDNGMHFGIFILPPFISTQNTSFRDSRRHVCIIERAGTQSDSPVFKRRQTRCVINVVCHSKRIAHLYDIQMVLSLHNTIDLLLSMLICARPALVDVVLMVCSRLRLELRIPLTLLVHVVLQLALLASVFTCDKLAIIGLDAAGKTKRENSANYQPAKQRYWTHG